MHHKLVIYNSLFSTVTSIKAGLEFMFFDVLKFLKIF